ncbi:hypothetical protein BU64_22590 [Escherichia coli O128:H2 str. 2011C-3317]|nr:hypothetical protein BU57_10485 [Escherichia coli O121:H19 str. 2011C-3609]KDV64540.1 hypothetical protein BU64_22590 [Escherichia coli O128:H2 str. 2011C-3317]
MLRLRSLTPVTYLCKLLGIHSLAAFLQLELFRVYSRLFFYCIIPENLFSGSISSASPDNCFLFLIRYPFLLLINKPS